ncbi:putative immunoglobulin-blocking virulence protein [Mycoplasmopsis gallopavonis]|uniref:Immunoglobulin-blocking virulence protein n=1 Tax=Mycoplasmopsis gallopavonis TaxID=76629 RepID=A0A449B0E8_9BACT|nr:putative immunoglobulin-blocking virulence protein [Mycoplasmopsis gallopavonis]RIV16559.1 putative immunoglobulin-blocking virulence protein [Mycoplasmopsis gallopavonis]VEU73240.1 Uncharacterised protein [Mycoplasmopsis gallopavonis]
MIRARKNKILKSMLVLGSSIMGAIGISSIVFHSRAKSDIEEKTSLGERVVEPILSDHINIIIKPQFNSLSDVNVILDEIETTVEFHYGEEIIGQRLKFKTKKNQELKYNIAKDIPEGYMLVPELYPKGSDIVLNPGELNIIQIQPIKQAQKTTFRFIDIANNQEVGTPVILDLEDFNQFNLMTYLPEGYQLPKNHEAPELVLGKVNDILVDKIHKEYTTWILYKLHDNAQTLIHKQKVITIDDQKIHPSLYIPQGYEFEAQSIQPQPIEELEHKNEYTFFIKKTQVKHTTTFIFKYQGQQIGDLQKIITYGEVGISLEQIKKLKPKAYEISSSYDANSIKFDQTNIVPLDKIREKDLTRFIFKTVDNQIIKNILFEEFKDVTLTIEQFLPQDYKLAPENTKRDISRGKTDNTNTYLVELINKPPKPEPIPEKPKPEPEPVPTPEKPVEPKPVPPAPKNNTSNKLSKEEINKIIQAGGSTIDARAQRYDKPSTMPVVEGAKLSGEILTAQKQKLTNMRALVAKISSPNYTFNAEDLRKVYSNLSDAELGRLVKYLNGATLKELGTVSAFPMADLTTEQQKESLKNQLNAMLEDADKYLAEGKILVFGNSFVDLNPRWGFPSDDYNPAFVRNKELNLKRGLANSGNNAKWGRNGSQLGNGDYYGWKKKSLWKDPKYKTKTNPEWSFGSDNRTFIGGSGITTMEYTATDDNDAGKKQGKQLITFMDASNPQAVQDIIEYLKQRPEISGLFIKNIGTKNPEQDISEILRDIPSSINKLTLIFDTEKMAGISYLKNKHFAQVELGTSINNVDDNLGDMSNRPFIYGWGIDPIIFQHTDFVAHDWTATKGFDNYQSSQVQYGPIQFNIIRPSADSSFEEVKKAFDIVLETHKDWRIFNGEHGDQGWPIKIDLSETKLKSLKDINLYKHKFRVLKLPSSGTTFTLDISDLGASQYSAILADWGPNEKPKILFGNDRTTKIHFKGNASDFSGKWAKELQGFLTGVVNNTNIRTIVVDNDDVLQILKGSPAWDSRFQIRTALEEERGGGFDFD